MSSTTTTALNGIPDAYVDTTRRYRSINVYSHLPSPYCIISVRVWENEPECRRMKYMHRALRTLIKACRRNFRQVYVYRATIILLVTWCEPAVRR